MAEDGAVAIVGGGIGGASLACALARAGVEVTVLEATEEYEDRVRGESMHAWGVKEARELGVEDVLLAAGAHVAPVWKQYAEGRGEVAEIPMSMMVPGIPGTLNLRHPVACQALVDAAADGRRDRRTRCQGREARERRGADGLVHGGRRPARALDVAGRRRGRSELHGAQADGDHTGAGGADDLHRGPARRRARRGAGRP